MIDADHLIKLIQDGGRLAHLLKGFEPRAQQQEMMRSIIESFNQEKIALIEAGTGTGKSIAYLIPALFWASYAKERVVISTHTITLQEQLVNKDIPLLLKLLNIDLKVTLVKGMGNYLCLRKLSESQEELLLFPDAEMAEIERIKMWSEQTVEGSRSDLPFVPTGAAWERVCAEGDTCNQNSCPHAKACFFLKARKEAQDSQVLIVNHHLLFADLVQRMEGNVRSQGILPPYTRVVIDEAHHVEEVATDYFSNRISKLQIMHLLGRLSSDKLNKTVGKLPFLKDKISNFYGRNIQGEVSKILSRLNIEIPALKHDLIEQTSQAFDVFRKFVETILGSDARSESENKLRLLKSHLENPMWKEEVLPSTKRLLESLKDYSQVLTNLENQIQGLGNVKLNEQTEGVRFEIQAMSKRFEEVLAALAMFVGGSDETDEVRWIEIQPYKGVMNINLVNAELDISYPLVKALFKKFPTIVLCSATLTTNQKFDFMRNRLGLNNPLMSTKPILEKIFESPFNYLQQAMLAVPTDLPSPTDPRFTEIAAERIWDAIQASQGNAFVLFTSYSMLITCHQILSQRLEQNKYVALKQGDDNRQALLGRFKRTERSVLFGTSSFWEGVDVAGDALRCVIIVKLPFQVPSEPIIQARTEAILARGGDPFMEYSIPSAIVKFKQGFGRLIRNKKDRGCVVCLDPRLITKGYGRLFLNSLPPCQQFFAESSFLAKQMTDFYQRTNHLVEGEWSVTESNR